MQELQSVTDVDQNHSTDVISSIVQNEIDKVSAVVSQPGTKTTSFYVTLATFIAGIFATWLVSKGILTPENHEAAATVLQAGILLVIGWAITTFLKGRANVAAIKAEAAAKRELMLLDKQ